MFTFIKNFFKKIES